VEGFTNPAWVLYMALVHVLPLPPAKTSLAIQITSALLLAANLWVVRRIALTLGGGSTPVVWGALALTATYLPINAWSLEGMEVGVVVLLTTIALWLAIRTLDDRTFHASVYGVLGASTFVRPDMAVPLAALCAFMSAADRLHWRRHLAWGALTLLAAASIQGVFAKWYYGDVLPNTYYLKVAGVPLLVRLARGVYVLLQFVWKLNVLVFLLPFALALRGDRRTLLLLWILAVQMAYSVYVGGDAWEFWGGSNRYICIAMPVFFILLANALWLVAGSFAAAAPSGRFASSRRRGRAEALVFGGAVVGTLLVVNSIHGPSALAELLLIRVPLHAGPGDENQTDVETALALRRATTADARIAVMRAGTIPYFAERPSVDLLGKNDRHVARTPPHLPDGPSGFADFRPGHVKFDFAYSIGQRQPDVVLQLRRRERLAVPFLDGYDEVLLNGTCAYVRRDSPRVVTSLMSRGCG
jgi:arabinofuranosyltransferase